FTGELQLARQIGNGDMNVIVKFDTLDSPFAGVPAEIQQPPGSLSEDDRQSCGEGQVRIKMVERKPTLSCAGRQGSQSFGKCIPASQSSKANRAAFLKRFVQIEHAAITNLVNDIHVDARHRVVKDEVTKLRQDKSLRTEAE